MKRTMDAIDQLFSTFINTFGVWFSMLKSTRVLAFLVTVVTVFLQYQATGLSDMRSVIYAVVTAITGVGFMFAKTARASVAEEPCPQAPVVPKDAPEIEKITYPITTPEKPQVLPPVKPSDFDVEQFDKWANSLALENSGEINAISLFQSAQQLGQTLIGATTETINDYNLWLDWYAEAAFEEKFDFSYDDFEQHIKNQKGSGVCRNGWSPASSAQIWGVDYYTMFRKVTEIRERVGRGTWPLR